MSLKATCLYCKQFHVNKPFPSFLTSQYHELKKNVYTVHIS